MTTSTLPAGCSGGRMLDPVRRCRLMGYYLGYYMGYYMGYGGPVGVSGWGGPAGTPVCCRRWERCFALRLDDSSTLPATTWVFDDHGLLLG